VDNQGARFVLSAFRPGGQDANDARFAEALEQVRRDPILERWFEESAAFDAAMTEKLRAVQVPQDLRETILAGAKVSRSPSRPAPVLKWAIAALLILSATLGSLFWQRTRPAHLVGWQTRALDVISSLVRNESTFDAQSGKVDDLISFLRANHAPGSEKLPDNLSKLTSLGCKTFSWNGVAVSVICFTRPDGGLVHLVTTKATQAAVTVVKTRPAIVRRGNWATATWREGDKIYMLAVEGAGEPLLSYLPTS